LCRLELSWTEISGLNGLGRRGLGLFLSVDLSNRWRLVDPAVVSRYRRVVLCHCALLALSRFLCLLTSPCWDGMFADFVGVFLAGKILIVIITELLLTSLFGCYCAALRNRRRYQCRSEKK